VVTFVGTVLIYSIVILIVLLAYFHYCKKAEQTPDSNADVIKESENLEPTYKNRRDREVFKIIDNDRYSIDRSMIMTMFF